MGSDYRTKCFEAHGQVCERCGRGEHILAHHINEDRSDNRIENLAPLCEKCHVAWHRGDEFDLFDAFLESDARTGAPDHIREIDTKILDELHTDRVTPTFAANETGVSREYISDRLKRLTEHGHVEKVAPGLYELVADPREGDHA